MLPPPATVVALATGLMHCVVLPVAEATPGDCTAAAYVAYTQVDLPPDLKATIPLACRTCLGTNTTCESRTPNATEVALMNDGYYGVPPLTPCCPPGDATCGNDPTQPAKGNYQVSCQYCTANVCPIMSNDGPPPPANCQEAASYANLGEYPPFNASYYDVLGAPCTPEDYAADPGSCCTSLNADGSVDSSSCLQRPTTWVLNPNYAPYRCWRACPNADVTDDGACDLGNGYDAFVYNFASKCLKFSGNETACRESADPDD
eukprot:SAG31_NODE_11772_length_999_cov_1.592222_1_plen_260_part_10